MAKKKKYDIEYLPIAEVDLANILLHIRDENPLAARNLLDKFEKSIALLANHPQLGALPSDAAIRKTGHRFIVVGEYLVFYVLYPQKVQIRRILHGAQDLKRLVGEMPTA